MLGGPLRVDQQICPEGKRIRGRAGDPPSGRSQPEIFPPETTRYGNNAGAPCVDVTVRLTLLTGGPLSPVRPQTGDIYI